MFHNNKELRLSLILLSVATAILTLIAATISIAAGALVLLLGLIAITVHLATEYYRYRKLQKLSSDLDKLLISGTPLPISEYNEGELSILANHIQKLTLRLTESVEAIKAEKLYLAASLADISHQLRTPLTSMNLTVSLLASEGLSEERRLSLTHDLRKCLRRIDWLIEALLKISRIDAGTVRFKAESVSVLELVEKAVGPLAITMELKEQTLLRRIAGERFTGDMAWCAEALGNILKNCVEHTPNGGQIEITSSETALYTEIIVRDNGSGFDPADLPHLFERFYKGRHASAESIGIGLALSRMVIAAQNGVLQASNRKGGGAQFVIRFYKGII